MIKIRRALISVHDKSKIVDFAKVLDDFSVEIISTGGTAEALRKGGLSPVAVSDITGFPEILSGRVKTLHPAIFGGLLVLREDATQMAEIEKEGIRPIDMVVINLYPFEKTVEKPGVSLAEAVENIDIGGPSMIRAASKNFSHVAVLTSPDQYADILAEMQEHDGSLSEETLRKCACEAFARTCLYDSAIETYLRGLSEGDDTLPERLWLNLSKSADLRYGENPHQKAALYVRSGAAAEGVVAARQLHGKALSFNNYLDLNAALGVVQEFSEPCAVILKHNNPCGVASSENQLDAYTNALATDSVSAFGGIVGFNRTVEKSVAEKLSEIFLEVILAPSYEDDALEILKKKKNLRLLELSNLGVDARHSTGDLKTISGGFLLQDVDREPGDSEYSVVTKRQPTEEEWRALTFGWKIVKWVKSNSVIFVHSDRTLGIGAGQMSRVDSSRFAVAKARDAGLELKGSSVASDAFFPFRDGIDAAAAAGAVAVIQPGGSIRDQEVIDAADEHGMAMVFTKVRHFRH